MTKSQNVNLVVFADNWAEKNGEVLILWYDKDNFALRWLVANN